MKAEAQMNIINQTGMHARAAAQFVQVANRFASDVFVAKEGHEVNGKSIMGVLLLVASQGSILHVRCEGLDAQPCLEALQHLISQGFGEGKT